MASDTVNTNTFGTVIYQVAAQAPEQLESVGAVVSLLTGFTQYSDP
ncbi:MAG: hypothetical protein K6C99_11885 [Lachnospiraceae bacterium]|nr:hypothetical protein [Lachnospiraceae bacterium]